MSILFYMRLAAQNIRKNSRTYVPYILTCIGSVMVFNILLSLSLNTDLDDIYGGSNMRMILCLGCIIIAVFTGLFLFYTNSFLIKRRKTEIGLFNILGMEKKHIGRIMFFETVTIAMISLTGGIGGGFLLSKGVYLLLLRMVRAEVQWGFHFSGNAAAVTVIFYGCLFLVILAVNMARVHVSSPMELLRGGLEGEREPKTRWITAVAGIVFLGMGYYMAVVTENPIFLITGFFVAVIFVIIGTYCLFIAGSTAILKFMKRRKTFYYKTEHFIAVSGMLYRMKQNAAGLAGICVLSTSVMVMLSSTVSLYSGINDVLENRFVRDISLKTGDIDDSVRERMDQIVADVLQEKGLFQENTFRYKDFVFSASEETPGVLVPVDPKRSGELNRVRTVCAITQDDYNRSMGAELSLKSGEAVVFTGDSPYMGDSLTLYGRTYRTVPPGEAQLWDTGSSFGSYGTFYVILSDMEEMKKLVLMDMQLNGAAERGIQYEYAFDLDGSGEMQVQAYTEIMDRMKELAVPIRGEAAAEEWGFYFSLHAGLLFLGIFLGAIFIMATVLIIYYKQVTEGYDDKIRFEIMQKVGLSKAEIRSSIRSQILMMFFLPLAASGVHIMFAFPMIARLLALMNMTNVKLFAWCTAGTFGVFAAAYCAVYMMTSRVYMKIVS